MVKVGKALSVGSEFVLQIPQGISGARAPEAREIHDVQRADVVRFAGEVLGPEALAPEAEALHRCLVIAEGSVRIRGSFQVHVVQLTNVCAHDLVRVDKRDSLHLRGKQYVKEKDFVGPHDPLLIALAK